MHTSEPHPSPEELFAWLREQADDSGRVTGARNFYYDRGYSFAEMKRPRRDALAELEANGRIRRVGPRNSSVYEIVGD